MKAHLLAGATALVCCAAPTPAQTANPPVSETSTPEKEPQSAADVPTPDQDIVVTGIRSSLRSSVATKRNADNIVDSISAEDTGKFPDNNVAESLQRITGVAIDRSGGEGQFITVRGLGPEFNTVLVNGRIMATDNDGREFSFDVLSSNMIQRTDVFKTSLPQLQEGGIGSTVNVVTARPLDGRSGFHVSAAIGGIYDTLADKTSPDMSAVASWASADKTFGIVLSGSYTDRRSQNDFVNIGGWILGPEGLIDGSASATGLTADALTTSGDIHTPRDLNFNREYDRRQRINLAGAIQSQINDDILLTVDGIYSKFDVRQDIRRFGLYFTPRFIDLATDANGTVTGFNRPGSQFLAANPALTDPALADERVTLSQNDNIVYTYDRKTESYQFGANLAIDATDRLKLKFDASATRASRDQPHQWVVVGTLAQTSPRFDLTPENDIPTASNLGPIDDANILRAHYALNQLVRVRDEGIEFHVDGEWKMGGGVLRSLMAGAAYNERRKIRTVADNSDSVCTYCGYDVSVPANLVTAYSLDGYLTGASGSDTVPRNFFTFDPADIFDYLSQPSTLATARQGRTAEEQAAEATRIQSLDGGAFGLRDRPGQRLDVEEKVAAAYLNANIGGERWSANVGVRVVNTRVTSRGFGQSVIGITVNPGDDNLNFSFGPAQAITIKNDYTDILPSMNAKLEITPRMFLRGAVSRTVTRPTLTSLGTDNAYGGRITNATSSGGNPLLEPFESINYDLSSEYYLSDVSYVSLAGFYKKFANFLETQTLPVELAGFTFQDTRTRNGQSGSIAGVEIGGQYTLDRLPGLLAGFGVAGNYTYVTSKVERGEGTSATECGYNGLSPHSANGSIFYEKYGIQARGSYNWRSSFQRACFGAASRPEHREAYGQFDASIAYDLNDHLQIYVQGVNITNQYVRDYSVREERLLLLQNTGSRYLFGARMRF